MKRTAGSWTLEDRHAFFLAGDLANFANSAGHEFLLLAVNEIGPNDTPAIEALLDDGCRLLIDSGIFWLTNKHARAHGITMNDALALPPGDLDGFDRLMARYLTVFEMFGDRAWGFIELDQGGRAQKVETRAGLEERGIVPMPVYHPLHDGWDYFDELAGQYDRVCVGNVVQADRQTRARLATTLWERHRAYPDLWVHLLGFTPAAMFAGWPCDSSDSSTWLSGLRWQQNTGDRSLFTGLGPLPQGFRYDYKVDAADPTGTGKATALAATTYRTLTRNWRAHEAALAEHLEVPAFPPYHPNEPALRPVSR